MVLVVLLVLACSSCRPVADPLSRSAGAWRAESPCRSPRQSRPSAPAYRGRPACGAGTGKHPGSDAGVLALALLNLIATPAASLAVTGAWVFLIARVLYVGIYLAGVPVARTSLWVASVVGLALMVVPLLDKV